ncbi:MAG TPA: hypothetical protein VFP54_06715, partial [Acidimicrobiales bacterium]|nr:hypothetical protein [Acidimicrobiales bacterium]
MSGGRDYRGDVPAATVAPSIHDLYVALDGGPDSSQPSRRRRRPFIAGRAIRIMVVVLAFAAGVAVDAAVFHLGDRPRAAGVVIGDQVIRQRTPQRTLTHPPPSPPFVSLSWGAAVLVDPSASLQSISCPTDRFCAAVDTQGQASQYVDGVWSSPRRIDGDTAINSISCTDMSFCLAVDERGNALRYDGTKWSAPLRIDKTTFPELTTVSCSSRSFCAAMDGDG